MVIEFSLRILILVLLEKNIISVMITVYQHAMELIHIL